VQLAEQNLPKRVRRLAEFMTGSLDSSGYFTSTIPHLAVDAALSPDGVADPTADEIRSAWAAIRSLDPPGVGAMDLRDCLLLQLDRLPDSTPHVEAAREVVRHYFDLFSRRNFTALADESGISPDEIRAANELIISLNPPRAASISAESDTDPGDGGVTPDFVVETDGERVSVSMPNSLPELTIERSFDISEDAPDSEGNEFIRANARQARTFIEMLARRRRTLMAIVTAIVRHQRDFFTSGDDESRIRPMVLRDIAAATGLDISTISRATAGKWLATPLGVYSLKSFFNEQAGPDASARELEAAIRDIIGEEDPSQPVGDDALTAILAERGIKVARRTVAKYRDRMGILPARLRRKG
ncbi:MAG: RNA polymerase factor sigma-54, partial [Muribaculaceae bacterium]|nr:RNA polymerase factor sigma-54 [Muribaculaceae bacterium]